MTPAPGRDDTTGAGDEVAAEGPQAILDRALTMLDGMASAAVAEQSGDPDEDEGPDSILWAVAQLRAVITGDCPNCITPWKCNGPHVGKGMEL